MPLVDEVKDIIATQADGHHHALVRIAQAVDALAAAGGGVQVSVPNASGFEAHVAGLKDDVHSQVTSFLDNLRDSLGGEVTKLRDDLAALDAKLQGQPVATPPAPPPAQGGDQGGAGQSVQGAGAQQGAAPQA